MHKSNAGIKRYIARESKEFYAAKFKLLCFDNHEMQSPLHYGKRSKTVAEVSTIPTERFFPPSAWEIVLVS